MGPTSPKATSSLTKRRYDEFNARRDRVGWVDKVMRKLSSQLVCNVKVASLLTIPIRARTIPPEIGIALGPTIFKRAQAPKSPLFGVSSVGMLSGVKVLEVAQWAFVPSAAAVLADWGADVIKVESPKTADPLRGVVTTGAVTDVGDYNYMVEQMNRGKRSIGLDLAQERGYELFLRLVQSADVLLTSFLDPARERLRIRWEDLRSVNPRLVYARGHGQGQRGPDANKPGFDGVSYWARGGICHMLSPIGAGFVGQRPAFGDATAGMFLAGGVAAALYRRGVTGEGGCVDTSLFGTAVWMLAPDILASATLGTDSKLLPPAETGPKNPLSFTYDVKDGRMLKLSMLDSDRYWSTFCHALRLLSLLDDPRFIDFEQRSANHEELTRYIAQRFLKYDLQEWNQRLTSAGCIWAPVQSPLEASRDPQAIANGYVIEHPVLPDKRLVSSPVQYNGDAIHPKSGAPEWGQHTEEVLLELGLTWADIVELKASSVII